jgi:hypothetical protein
MNSSCLFIYLLSMQLVELSIKIFNYQTSIESKKQNSYLNLCATHKSSVEKSGGDDRSRTCDFLNANQALCQLSYIPRLLVAGAGFEPATFGL